MITISNLRIEDIDDGRLDGYSRVVADIDVEHIPNPYHDEGNEIWFATRDKHMLSHSYDAFLLIPLYIAMTYKQDLHICGKVSKRLYHNIMSYVQTILCDFSDKLSRVNVIVDGFNDERDSNKGGGNYRHKLFVWDRFTKHDL